MKLIVKISQLNDGRYRAWCPALPGCTAQADSRDEAQSLIQRVIRHYMMSMNEALPQELESRLLVTPVA